MSSCPSLSEYSTDIIEGDTIAPNGREEKSLNGHTNSYHTRNSPSRSTNSAQSWAIITSAGYKSYIVLLDLSRSEYSQTNLLTNSFNKVVNLPTSGIDVGSP